MSIAPPDGLRVLIVEDEDGVRRMLERWCATDGWAVSAAGGLDEAKRGLAEHPRLVFVDLTLGHESGWEVVRLASAAGSAVVLMTGGDVDDDLRADARLIGAHAVLGKPFTEQELWAAVRRALAARPLE